jgi:hypothetical protein
LGKENRAARIGLMRWSRLSLMQTVGLAIGLIALGLAFNHVYANYVIPDIKVQEALRKMFAALPDTPLNAVMLFVAIAGIAPLLEEILFRGLVQNALAKKLPAWGAILGASAIFGAVHMDYHAFPALMAMGAVFGILYHKTGSLAGEHPCACDQQCGRLVAHLTSTDPSFRQSLSTQRQSESTPARSSVKALPGLGSPAFLQVRSTSAS